MELRTIAYTEPSGDCTRRLPVRDCSKLRKTAWIANEMPDSRDLAALPTSWALTIWDAMPVFLSVELAIAVLLVATLQRSSLLHAWRLTSVYSAGGVVYLFLFDLNLAIVLVLVTVASAFAQFRLAPDSPDTPAPASPFGAIKMRGGAVIWEVAKASAIAALIKIIIAPELSQGSPAWVGLALFGGLILPSPLGVAAIPALSVGTASDGLISPAVWIASAAIRPYLAAAYLSRRNPAASTG